MCIFWRARKQALGTFCTEVTNIELHHNAYKWISTLGFDIVDERISIYVFFLLCYTIPWNECEIVVCIEHERCAVFSPKRLWVAMPHHGASHLCDLLLSQAVISSRFVAAAPTVRIVRHHVLYRCGGWAHKPNARARDSLCGMHSPMLLMMMWWCPPPIKSRARALQTALQSKVATSSPALPSSAAPSPHCSQPRRCPISTSSSSSDEKTKDLLGGATHV